MFEWFCSVNVNCLFFIFLCCSKSRWTSPIMGHKMMMVGKVYPEETQYSEETESPEETEKTDYPEETEETQHRDNLGINLNLKVLYLVET